MSDKDFDKNMITLFFRLANALGDARDNVIAEVGKENSTSELLFYLEKVCDGMIERYSIGAEINER